MMLLVLASLAFIKDVVIKRETPTTVEMMDDKL